MIGIVFGGTYPGTASPFRGLFPFGEPERDVFLGRDRERDELAKLITGEAFRAGLLYGAAGVGKTSLLRASLVPYLRDMGVIAFYCEDLSNPVDWFASAVASALGRGPQAGETSLQFLTRCVGELLKGQQFLFIVDDAQGTIFSDLNLIDQVADLFSRVVSRSSGRARFLFCCHSHDVHRLSLLERRTGSLFPPLSRYELLPFAETTAAQVLDRIFALNGHMCEPGLPTVLAQHVGTAGHVLPFDLQMAATACKDMGITQLAQLGSAPLTARWIEFLCDKTTEPNASKRIVGAVSAEQFEDATVIATRAFVTPDEVVGLMQMFAGLGVAASRRSDETFEFSWAHPSFRSAGSTVSALAQASFQKTQDLLSTTAQAGKHLTLREYRDIKRDHVTPRSQTLAGLITRSGLRFKLRIAAAFGLAFLIWLALSASHCGRGHFVIEGDAGEERVILRGGRAWLRLPLLFARPGINSLIVDTGVTAAMVTPTQWKKLHETSATVKNKDALAQTWSYLDPYFSAILRYAETGDEAALAPFESGAVENDGFVRWFSALKSIARGTPKEVSIVEKVLAQGNPLAKAEALAAAVSATQRGSSAYQTVLLGALTQTDPGVRALAVSAILTLPSDVSQSMFRGALGQTQDASVRHELGGLVSQDSPDAPSGKTALLALTQPNVSSAALGKAVTILKRAIAVSPKETVSDLLALLESTNLTSDTRQVVITLLYENCPAELYPDVAAVTTKLVKVADEPTQAQLLPLRARVAPESIAGELAVMQNSPNLTLAMRMAIATAWGEVAKTKEKPVAQVALEKLVKEASGKVQAAAAESLGYVGRASVEVLQKMVKTESTEVALGAARGLVHAVSVGASPGSAVNGIETLWKRKGLVRRQAARIAIELARTKPQSVSRFLREAATSKEDTGLFPLGAEGLCRGLAVGKKSIVRLMAEVVKTATIEVRRQLVQCLVDENSAALASDLALTLSLDSDVVVRGQAARLLRDAISQGVIDKSTTSAITSLVKDGSRDIRSIAIEALAALGDKAPSNAPEMLLRAFEAGDENERVTICNAARRIGSGQVVALALVDASPKVRLAGIETAMATGTNLEGILGAALVDADPTVREKTLEKISQGEKLEMAPARLHEVLLLASTDKNPAVRSQALVALTKRGEPQQLLPLLASLLSNPSEQTRVSAVLACEALSPDRADDAIRLLEPHLDDPSHDVRVALLRSLATAYASSPKLNIEKLGRALVDSETHALRRWVFAASLYMAAKKDDKDGAASKLLESIGQDTRAFSGMAANVVLGLVRSSSEGIGFLERVVP